MTFDFIINGRRVSVSDATTTTTLLDWLRAHGLTGTKCGCAEGDCGACSVAVVERDSSGRTTYRAVNSCLALMPMVAGREIVTVEGIAPAGGLHPVQGAMVENHGSQCGYCTPGIVVSMVEGYYRRDCATPEQVNDQLCGNLCRCTGYRAIRDAALAAFEQRKANGDDRLASRLAVPTAPLDPIALQDGADRFERPANLSELLSLKHEHPKAVLVAGATEIGVELNKKFRRLPFLISTEAVPELTAITESPAGWRIGAAATLTAIEERLASEYTSLAKMLRLFAARQIRNRATLGGNLATASPIGDSAPVLLTLDAELVLASIAGERVVPLGEFFTGYRQTALRPTEVIKEIVVPRFPAGAPVTRRVDFIKVSHRRELDISIVAAAFRLDVDGAGIVRVARLAFAGVADRTRRALRAEAALVGRTVAAALPDVRALLADEFAPISDVRSGAGYRRGLVLSLWEKFAAAGSDDEPADESFRRGKAWNVVEPERALRHESAVGHVTGRAQYVHDTAVRRRMLEVWPICAPHARARILRRDATRARALPGIAAVVLAEDIPGTNNVGPVRHDEPLFATNEISYHGQLIGVVVGESVALCRAAAAEVDVEYEPLTPILGIEDAIAKESFHTDWQTLARGDVAAALAAAPQRFTGEFTLGGQEHFYLETQAAWAEAGEDDSVVVHSSTQHPSEIQAIVGEVLGLARHQVVVHSPRMGGGFGGKETQGNAFAAIVALAARRTGQPVRLQLDRDLDMMITGKRHPFHARFEIGHDLDGRLCAAAVELVSDGGWSLDLSQAILGRALFHLDNAYYIPAVQFRGRVAKTNTASNTAFRGFGGPQGMLVIEEIIDRVARRVALPAEVVRQRNFYRGHGETNTTHYGQELGDNRLDAIWGQLTAASRFAERRRAIAEWNAAHPRRKRGLAMTPVKFGISFTVTHYNQAGALVLLYQDGTAQVNHGGTEMGQGLQTKVLGVAMRTLGLTADRIRMMTTSTDKVPNMSATAASSGADLNGAAVAAACTTLQERLRPIAARMLSELLGANADPAALEFANNQIRLPGTAAAVGMAEVCRRAYTERVSLAATGYYGTPGLKWDPRTGQGRPFHYFAYGAAAAEVEVDGATGMHRVRRVDIVHDVGDSLNPGIDRGQIEGGFVQGMGWLTCEALRWDARGQLLTHGASTYAIPTIGDAPAEFNVDLLSGAHQPGVIHGSKAVGEPPLMLAISVREALRDAVAAFGAAQGVGLPLAGRPHVALASPATGEAIYEAIQLATRAAGAPSRNGDTDQDREGQRDEADVSSVFLKNSGRDEFMARFGHLFEHSPWIVEETFRRGPFRDAKHLHHELCRTMRDAEPERQLALICAHPDLAGRLARQRQLTAVSVQEQAHAGLDQMNDDEVAELQRLNAEYRTRHGFPFVICARLNQKDAILTAMRARMENPSAAERRVALAEIEKIAWLRLQDALRTPH